MVKLQIKTAVRPRQNRFKQYCMAQGVITATKAYYHASVVCKYIDMVEKAKAAPKNFYCIGCHDDLNRGMPQSNA